MTKVQRDEWGGGAGVKIPSDEEAKFWGSIGEMKKKNKLTFKGRKSQAVQPQLLCIQFFLKGRDVILISDKSDFRMTLKHYGN